MSLRPWLAVLLCLSVLPVIATMQRDESGQADPSFRITLGKDSLSIHGVASSVAHQARLQSTAADYFASLDVELDVVIAPALPAGWSLVTDRVLRALASTREADAVVTAREVLIRGVTTDAEAWQSAILALRDSLPAGMSFHEEVVATGPYAPLERQCIEVFRTAMRGRSIEFAVGSADLGTAARPLLDELVQVAADCPDSRISVTGHTDNTGDEAFNVYLSQARADAVAGYFVAAGIPASRLTAKGVGSSEPLVTGNDSRARRLNRRIDIDIDFETEHR